MEILVFNANSVNPEQMPHSVASDLGLHCLLITLLGVFRLKCVDRKSEESEWLNGNNYLVDSQFNQVILSREKKYTSYIYQIITQSIRISTRHDFKIIFFN